MIYLSAFAASFLYVALRTFQQRNNIHNQYIWIMPTSMAMAVGDMVLVTAIATNGISLIFVPIGIGGGLGGLVSMWLHRRWGLS